MIHHGTIDSLVCRAADERDHRELSVMHAVIHDPANGVAVAKELGAGIHLFDRQDMMVMWIACQGAGHLGRDAVERVSYQLLRDEGLINANGRGINGLWTREVLARFVRHFGIDPAHEIQRITLTLLVPKLIETYSAQRTATDYVRHACTLLERGAA